MAAVFFPLAGRRDRLAACCDIACRDTNAGDLAGTTPPADGLAETLCERNEG